jgi:DNA-binding FadR family transcriptional regulator
MINRLMLGPKAPKPGDKNDTDANRKAVLASHEEIYDAIVRGNVRDAREAMERHIQDIVEKTMRLFVGSDVVMSRELSEEELAYSG